VIFRAFFWAPMRRNLRSQAGFQIFPRGLAAAAGGCMTHRLPETLSDQDFRNLARLISACTLGLWAFAVGLLIGTFLFS
jgi:hypothetical protein